MQYIVLYVFLAIVCLLGLSYNKPALNDVIQIQKNANSLRGVFAIFIIFTHCTLAFQTMPALIVPLRKVSTFGVGFFFVLSGYGLAFSFHTKKDYLKGFIIEKVIKKIAFAAIVCRVISKLLLVLFIKDTFKMPISQFFIGINWYIYAMCILYISFYLVYTLVKNSRYRLSVLWLLVILITIIFLYVSKVFHAPGIDRSYFISEWAFPLGVTIYEKREELDKLMNDYPIRLFLFMLVFLAATFVGATKVSEYTILDLVTHNLMLVPFYYFVMLACRYITFGNPILKFLNRISFEIYLYQFAVLIIAKEYIDQINVMYFVYVTVLTILLAYIIRCLNVLISKVSVRHDKRIG